MAKASTGSCQTASPTSPTGRLNRCLAEVPLTLLITQEIIIPHLKGHSHSYPAATPCLNPVGIDQILPKAVNCPANYLHVGNGRCMYSPYEHRGHVVLQREGQMVPSLWICVHFSSKQKETLIPEGMYSPRACVHPTPPHPGRQKTQLPETLQRMSDQLGYFTAVSKG